MSSTKIQNNFYLGILLLSAVLVFFVIRPFLSAIFLAVVLAVLFRPLYTYLKRKLKERESLSALLTILLVVLVILLPLAYFTSQMAEEAGQLYIKVTSPGWVESIVVYADKVALKLGVESPRQYISSLALEDYASPAISWVVSHVGSIFSSIARLLLTIFISLLGFYALLKEGSRLKSYLVFLSPVDDRHDEEIFDRMGRTVNSVVRGALVLAFLQGVIATVGFVIFGLPQPMLWGGLTAVAALIPGIGTALVVFPAGIYLLFGVGLGQGIGLLIWGVVAVGLVDNILGPRIMGRGVAVHPFFIFLAVLGGLQLFGPVGFIAGPLVLSFFVALLDIYPLLARK